MTTPLEQIKEKIEDLRQENNYSTAYGDWTPERAIEEEARTQGYNRCLSDIQSLLPSIIQEVVEETRKDTVLLLHKRLSETSDWNKAIGLFMDDLASLKETNK